MFTKFKDYFSESRKKLRHFEKSFKQKTAVFDSKPCKCNAIQGVHLITVNEKNLHTRTPPPPTRIDFKSHDHVTNRTYSVLQDHQEGLLQ